MKGPSMTVIKNFMSARVKIKITIKNWKKETKNLKMKIDNLNGK